MTTATHGRHAKPITGGIFTRQIKAENDNAVFASLEPIEGDGSCDSLATSPVFVGRTFREGGHSRTHALRFAAWLVHCADTSAGHGDFMAVLDAVEREAARADS